MTLPDQGESSALAVVLLGVDDDDLRERAEAELAQREKLLEDTLAHMTAILKAYQDLKARMGRIRALAGEE